MRRVDFRKWQELMIQLLNCKRKKVLIKEWNEIELLYSKAFHKNDRISYSSICNSTKRVSNKETIMTLAYLKKYYFQSAPTLMRVYFFALLKKGKKIYFIFKMSRTYFFGKKSNLEYMSKEFGVDSLIFIIYIFFFQKRKCPPYKCV